MLTNPFSKENLEKALPVFPSLLINPSLEGELGMGTTAYGFLFWWIYFTKFLFCSHKNRNKIPIKLSATILILGMLTKFSFVPTLGRMGPESFFLINLNRKTCRDWFPKRIRVRWFRMVVPFGFWSNKVCMYRFLFFVCF